MEVVENLGGAAVGLGVGAVPEELKGREGFGADLVVAPEPEAPGFEPPEGVFFL